MTNLELLERAGKLLEDIALALGPGFSVYDQDVKGWLKAYRAGPTEPEPKIDMNLEPLMLWAEEIVHDIVKPQAARAEESLSVERKILAELADLAGSVRGSLAPSLVRIADKLKG